MGTQPGAVKLNPASAPTSSTPTWSTSVGCPSGFQDSATFKEVHADGTSTNFIAPIANKTAAPFSGTLQASIAQIQKAGGIANGGGLKGVCLREHGSCQARAHGDEPAWC
jgi:hypothetical protein